MEQQKAIETHEDAMMEAFVSVLKAEDRIRHAKSELDAVKARVEPEIAAGESELRNAWLAVQALMGETGEVEVVLPGTACDYCIGFDTPREAVKVDDPSAVPDEWVEIERNAKKKEIAKYLKGLRDTGRAMPNWAALERGEPKLSWRAVKKGSA
jgi:hypothetical protein